MYRINIITGNIHRISDNFIISPPYDIPEYLEYADWINSGNSPEEFAETPLAPVPESVSKFQAKAALLQNNLLDDMETLINDPNTSRIIKLAWQDAQVFYRNSPTVTTIAQSLNLTDIELDNLFRLAASIEV